MEERGRDGHVDHYWSWVLGAQGLHDTVLFTFVYVKVFLKWKKNLKREAKKKKKAT